MAANDFIGFIEAASADPSLLDRLKEAGTFEEKAAAIQASGFPVTVADLQELTADIKESIDGEEGQELNDAELASVGGGFFLSKVWPDKWGGSKVGQLGDDIIGLVVGAVVPEINPLYNTLNKVV